jgi:MFS family permease
MTKSKKLDTSHTQLNPNIFAWFIFAVSCVFVIYKYVLEISPSVMVQDLMRTFSLDGFEVGHLAASYFYAYFLMQIPVGLLVDKFSTRKLITGAICLCSVGAFVFAKSDTLTVAVMGRILIGVGGAFSMVGTMKLITIWFERRHFALISGLMMTAAMIGAIFGEAPLATLVDNVKWRSSMLVLSTVGIILAFVFWILVRDKKKVSNTSEESKKVNIFKLFFEVMKNKQSWLVSIYSGLAFAPVTAFAGLWGTPFLMESYGMSKISVAGLISLIFVGFAIGSPLAGWMSEKYFTRKKIMLTGTSFAFISLVLIIYVPGMPVWFLGALLFIFGFFTGFFFVSFACMQAINKQQASGTSIGFINMFNALCGALCDPIIGKLLDLGWDHKLSHGVRVFSVHNYKIALLSLPIGLLVALFVVSRFKDKDQ